ncbi:Ankyrin [Carabus blaptoides fortunei]
MNLIHTGNINSSPVKMLSRRGVEENEVTILNSAISRNRISLVEHLISQQVPLNDRTDVGSTSLVLACELPIDTDIIQLLIQSGADTNIANADGIMPLHAACKTHKIDIIELLLAHGANINAQDSVLYTPLHYAVDNDDDHIVHTLLQNGADPSIVEQMGWNALVLALHGEHGRCAELILPYIKDINATAINGWTPLMHAIRGASKDMVIKLVENGANSGHIRVSMGSN